MDIGQRIAICGILINALRFIYDVIKDFHNEHSRPNPDKFSG